MESPLRGTGIGKHLELAISHNVAVQTISLNDLIGFMVDVCVESARQEIQEVKYPRGASYPSTHSTLAAAAYVRL